MKLIGLTGSIAMGKSTTAQVFAEAGVPVYDADATVHRLYETDAVPLIGGAFPGTIVDGKVDRAALGARVLHDREAMRRLEGLIHPLVRHAQAEFIVRHEHVGTPIAVLDVPLLFETGGDRLVDAVVVVSAPEAMQRERLMARPGMTVEKIEALLARQISDAEKRRRADFIIDSSRGLDPVRDQIRDILHAVAAMARRRP